MKQSRLRSILAAVLLSAMLSAAQGRDYVDYVNPMMGNISHLLVPTFPTVHLPNSMLRVVPERADYTADLLHGLPLITTSHRGRSAFNLFIDEATDYQYDNEEIRPYGYSVCLIEPQVQVRFAVSHQSGIYEVRRGRSEVSASPRRTATSTTTATPGAAFRTWTTAHVFTSI